MADSIKNVVLHAPNIHTGGGLVLLQEFFSTPGLPVRWAQLDERVKNSTKLPPNIVKHFVNRSVISRLWAEWRLWRTTTENDVVLCFHGLPPLLPLRGQVVVFVQNRILFETESLAVYSFTTKIRLTIERLWTRMMRGNCDRYIVQTPSMKNAVQRCLGVDVAVSVLPFAPSVDSFAPKKISASVRKYDFVYVASGEAHKNHNNLLEAWRLLANAGLKPSLALTVNLHSFPFLSAEITRYTQEYALNIVNLDQMRPMEVTNLYQSSSALIFPSKTESLGLPLIEATQLGLPVLASELDYVRDVIEPAETFDPNSPVSIARAVRRFLGNAEPTVQIRSAEEFLAEVLR
ncbi:MAG: glycosyltransferase [Methylophilales bacterium]|nr:glycosyltransferase [Methylophilales bacterium]